MNVTAFVPVNKLRREMSNYLSAMYAKEVPLYGVLNAAIREVNERIIEEHPELGIRKEDLDLISEERHGAIRLGKPSEMAFMAKVFGIMGMEPVNFYDLTDAGEKSQPVISTAFRPIDLDDIEVSPFRVFTSMLVPDDRRFFDAATSAKIHSLIDDRDIFSKRLRELVVLAEEQGGLSREQADSFMEEVGKLFSWAGHAENKELYDELIDPKRLNRPIAADIACFPNPHLNHLTPSSLDIDALYRKMMEILRDRNKDGEKMKGSIEGPPKREILMLLRQTSYQALVEDVTFTNESGEEVAGAHRARFGEIEQRGVALTEKGRKLYDEALAKTMAKPHVPVDEAFKAIPDSHEELRKQGLAYYTYHATEKGKKSAKGSLPTNLDELVEQGFIEARPIRYEDFLPVSAAGIFASNLSPEGKGTEKAHGESPYDQKTLSGHIGKPIVNSFDLYATQQALSIEAVFHELGLGYPPVEVNQVIYRAREIGILLKLCPDYHAPGTNGNGVAKHGSQAIGHGKPPAK